MEIYHQVFIVVFSLIYIIWITIGVIALMKHENECATHRHSAPNLKYVFYGFFIFFSRFRKRFKICDK